MTKFLNRTAKPTSVEPSDPYDTEAWLAFYAENPGYRRSVGAAGVNDDEGDDGEGDDDEGNDEGDDDAGDQGQGDDEGSDDDDGAGDDDDGEGDDDAGDKPTEREAKLLKEAMRRKQREQELKKQLDAFKDVDPDEYRKMKKEQKDAEQKKLEDKGEFDRVKKQIIEAHEAEKEELTQSLESKDKEIADLNKQISELTVGSSFNQSKFISEKTVYTPGKARRLYGDHFDVEDGQVVGYDKPRGEEDRAPLVDGSGNPLGFEAAMQKIVEADPERDEIMRATMKPGADSQGKGKKTADKKEQPTTSVDKIEAGLGDILKAGDSGPKFS